LLLVAAGTAWLLFAANSVNDNVPADAWIDECYKNDGSNEPVDCDGPHHFEVYSAGFYPDDMDYPNLLVRSLGVDLCEDDFEAYTGDNYFDPRTDYDYTARYPSEEGWRQGQRYVLCVLTHTELSQLNSRAGTPLGP
jgi:hypothetical protein